jgi:hypothetical protein
MCKLHEYARIHLSESIDREIERSLYLNCLQPRVFHVVSLHSEILLAGQVAQHGICDIPRGHLITSTGDLLLKACDAVLAEIGQLHRLGYNLNCWTKVTRVPLPGRAADSRAG